MMELTRLEDWEQRLNDYLATLDNARHGWGTLDCALHAANAVHAQTGVDLAADFRGKYDTEEGAREAIEAAGHKDLAALMNSLLPRRVRSMVQRGDIVMDNSGNLSVAFGDYSIAVGEDAPTGRTGRIRVTRSLWRKAWAVG